MGAYVGKQSRCYIFYNPITERVLHHQMMEENGEHIDYKSTYHEQVSINEKLSLKLQNLEFQLAQLKKLVFCSWHEKFVA